MNRCPVLRPMSGPVTLMKTRGCCRLSSTRAASAILTQYDRTVVRGLVALTHSAGVVVRTGCLGLYLTAAVRPRIAP